FVFFFFNDTATTEIYTLSLHDALPISPARARWSTWESPAPGSSRAPLTPARSEEHTSELQSHSDIVCRLLLAKKNTSKSSQPRNSYSRLLLQQKKQST